MQTTARSLILDLLSTLRRGSMPVRALIEAGALLGLAENNIRVSLARLYAGGHVERDERGRYRLGPAVAAISDRLRGWRGLDTKTVAWRGDWIAAQGKPPGRGADRERRARALDLLGFRELEPGLSLRPDNLVDGIEGARSSLSALCEGAPALRIFRVADLDPETERMALRLWDDEALAGEAKASVRRLQNSAASIRSLGPDQEAAAMVESFLVGGEVLRQLMRHPLLPPEILAPEPLTALLTEMKRYDTLGRGAWARFLARHDVPHRALPLDSRQTGPRLAAPVSAEHAQHAQHDQHAKDAQRTANTQRA